MTQTGRTVRIFISSTFRDMYAERDHLVKVVSPELRERDQSFVENRRQEHYLSLPWCTYIGPQLNRR